MNHNPSGESTNASSADPVPTPPERRTFSIPQVLGCLDLKLEDELNRFRAKQTARRQSMATNAATEVAPAPERSDFITGELVRSTVTATHSERDPAQSAQSAGGFIIIDGLHAPQSNLMAIARIDDRSSATTDFSHSYESLDLNFSPRGEITSFDREYSASSQELLRQIQSGYSNPTDGFATGPQSPPTPAKSKLFTPVKIGSLAAACIIAGGAAYTYYNPAILAPLMATKSIAPTTTASSSLGQVIQSPNLAANEFTDLNLSTLNTVKMPTAAKAPVATPTSSIANPTNAGTPQAIPFNGMATPAVPPATIVAQPRLADSLVRSLLPPNFHTVAAQPRYRALQPGLRR